MSNIYGESIIPLSELRSDLNKVKARLKRTPIVITVNGRPDFGVCDLETLEIAMKIRELRDLLRKRYADKTGTMTAEEAFRMIESRLHAQGK